MALKRGKRFEGSVAARWVAWSLCAAFFVMTFFVYALMFLNEADIVRGGLPFLGIASAVVGSLVASRQPRNVVGWFFLASAVFSTVRALFGEYAIYGIETSPGSVPFAEVAAWASLVLRVPGPILGFVCVPLFFPTGRPPSRRWSILVWTLLALTPVLMVFDAVAPVVAVYGTDIRNPFGLDALAPYMGFFQVFLIVCIVAFIFAAAMSLVARFRASSGVERQQIKWLTLAAAILPVWFTINGPIGENFPLAFIIADSLIIAGIPVAAGLAILRYRLYDIDFIINKTLVYGTLTAALVAVCLGMIVGSQFFFRSLTGGGSQIAIVASTLANVALFNPMRRRIQNLVDRRFYRTRYDAREALAEFSARASEARRTSTASRKTSSRSSKRPSSRNMPRCG